MELVVLSWHDVEKAVVALANTIRQEFEPDVIVGVARGGLIPAVRLSHLLGDKLLRVIHVGYYVGIDMRKEKPELLADVGELKGKVLVVDDVADTGKSLEFVVNLLKERGVKEMRVSTIAWKPRSKLKPDYFVYETDKWIVFPWEEAPVKRGR